MLTNRKLKHKTNTPTDFKKKKSPLIQSALTASSEEIEIQICDDDIIEFELSEKSSDATEVSSQDAPKKNKKKRERETLSVERQCSGDVRLFRSSDLDQPKQLRNYLEEVSRNPFNHYCLNCKKKQSTHVLVWLGVFVCQDCSQQFLDLGGGFRNFYVKNVFGELWDDYQLRSIAYGGNRNIFNVILENRLEKLPLIVNYSYPAIQIYINNLLVRMDGDDSSTKRMQPCYLQPWKTPKRSRSVIKLRNSFVQKQDKFVNGMEHLWEKGSIKVITKIKKTFKRKKRAQRNSSC